MMARNRIINWLDKKRVEKTEEFYPDLGDELVGALWKELMPLDGEEFDDLSDEQRARMRESM
jgi:hypothetical protein